MNEDGGRDGENERANGCIHMNEDDYFDDDD